MLCSRDISVMTHFLLSQGKNRMRRATVAVVLLGLLAVVSAGVQQPRGGLWPEHEQMPGSLSFHTTSFPRALVYIRRELVQQYIALVAACISC